MAKQSRETFKEMMAKLEADKVFEPKPVAVIEEREYFLIVCEGVRTEPMYFDYWKKFLPKHLVETIKIVGEGDNTINVVRKAIEERDIRAADPIMPNFDQVWAVFDRDDFPADRFDAAIALARQEGIENGASNQAFELWYVLHFQFLQTALHRNDYFAILSRELGFAYTKNDVKVVKALFHIPTIQRAIRWAEQLERMHEGKALSDACPLTMVYRLVKELMRYLNLTQ
jgi:hypothetical protein